MDEWRGTIRHRERALQVRDYSGLRFGKITPTDVDGLIEYHDKGYVIIELKYLDAELPYGQRLALQRLCDDLEQKKPTLLVIASHDNADGDIDAARASAVQYRFRAKWYPSGKSVAELVGKFIHYLDDLCSDGVA